MREEDWIGLGAGIAIAILTWFQGKKRGRKDMEGNVWKAWGSRARPDLLEEFQTGLSDRQVKDDDLPRLMRALRGAGVRSVTFHITDDDDDTELGGVNYDLEDC